MRSIECPPLAVELAGRLRELLDSEQVRKVSDPFSPRLRAGIRKLERAIADADIDQRDAEYAVAQWLIQKLPIEHCVAEQQTAEARAARRPTT